MNKKKRKFMVISILFVIDRLAINIAILFVISNSSSDNDSFPTIYINSLSHTHTSFKFFSFSTQQSASK